VIKYHQLVYKNIENPPDFRTKNFKTMKKEVKIPEIAENVEKGLIAGILVLEGDKVKADQPLVEIETDKATTDLPSPYDGVIEEIKVKEGDEVKVHQVIMIIETESGDEEGEGKGESEEESKDQDQDIGESEEKKKRKKTVKKKKMEMKAKMKKKRKTIKNHKKK
jgi:pyruvate dehydrogenase E2 component (dihydrolipoamide acetyltransferase)